MLEQPISRVGDLSVGICAIGACCCPHAWISRHIQGSPTVHANGRPEMRIGDIGISTCPHCMISYAITGSQLNLNNSIPVHRVGDAHIAPCGSGTCITGSPNVVTG